MSKRMLVAGLVVAGLLAFGKAAAAQQTIDLPTSKALMVPAPGGPQKVNSLPLSLAVSPDGRWVVSLNAGYGTAESRYMQSLAVLNTATGRIADFPDARVGERARQSFFSGLAFSADGTKVYASLASTTDPDGGPEVRGQVATGNGIVVYGFADGVLKPQGFLKLPMVKLAAGRHTDYWPAGDGRTAIPYPAAIAVTGSKLLVAENLSDSAVLMDETTGAIEKSFDLSQSDAVPGTYPVGLAVTKDGRRAFVALWNAVRLWSWTW